MQRIALGLEYDGTPYHGWQRQNDLATVQQEVENAIAKIVSLPVDVICAGRTDAGVHALGQVIHFDCPLERPLTAWTKGLNVLLPKSIRVLWAKPVQHDFHARFSAVARRYLYCIYSDPVSPGLFPQGVTWIYYPIQEKIMQCAAQYWIGKHDFSSFRDRNCQSKTPIRDVKNISIKRVGKLIFIEICANAFLHHMVRNMVGVLLVIGRGLKPVEFAQEVLHVRNRSHGVMTAPPSGLYLSQVYFESVSLPTTSHYPWYFQQLSL